MGLGKKLSRRGLRVSEKNGDLISQKYCEGATQSRGKKSAFRWQPKLQQSLQGCRPIRTSMTLARGNPDGNKVAHYSAMKVSSRRAVGHVGDAMESQERSILNCGDEMTFIDQPVVRGWLEKVACGDVKSCS